MLHLIHDTFFYACYACTVLVLLHRMVKPQGAGAIAATGCQNEAPTAPAPAAEPISQVASAPAQTEPVAAPEPEPGPVLTAHTAAAKTMGREAIATVAMPKKLPPIRTLQRLAVGKGIAKYWLLPKQDLYTALIKKGVAIP